MKNILNYINGQHVAPQSAKHLNNYNPSEGSVYSTLPDSDASDVALAYAAADKAFVGWSNMPNAQRAQVLLKIADLIDRDLEKLALAESVDNGKPVSLARAMDIPRASANMRFYATAAMHSS
ncbi:MAG: aldehyde dehydrogenase family protein, partial [Flammeovirgaceae bacterium]